MSVVVELEKVQQLQAEVEAVLLKFATSEPSPGKIPFSDLIPDISRWLVWEAREAAPTIERATARIKLKALKKAAKAMEADLLADPSLAVMIPLEDRLSIARIAHLEVSLKGKLGPPRNYAANRVATFLVQR
jgi:hypothetical protein